MEDYEPGSNLHIAVTTSRGDVVEFDQNGIHSHREERKMDGRKKGWQFEKFRAL